MFTTELIVLSYHKFSAEYTSDEYTRAYKQFRNDFESKTYDWITIDDGHESIIKACKMLQDKNIRAKLFITTASVGLPGFCTWGQLWHLSKFHDIGNHSHLHTRLTYLPNDAIRENIEKANEEIKKNLGITPRYFVPPYNNCNKKVETIAGEAGLITIKNRITILNWTG